MDENLKKEKERTYAPNRGIITFLILNICLSLLLLYILYRLNINHSLIITIITALVSFILISLFLIKSKGIIQKDSRSGIYFSLGLFDFAFRALVISSFLIYGGIFFYAYDSLFLGLFCLVLGIFIFRKSKKLKKEGIMFLYKTSVGLKFIDYVGNKYKKTLSVLNYISIALGYILMTLLMYFLIQLVYIFSNPAYVKIIKMPPIMPLFPYLPELFKLDFLPSFPFTYWIIAIALVAIFHEGFHGIFARFFKIRIKSTGFGFLGPFLAFFVEQDDKQMQKSKISSQLGVLSSGVFANTILAIIFFFLMILFLSTAYAPAGALFKGYTYSEFPVSALSSMIISNQTLQISGINFTKIGLENKSYFIPSDYFKIDKSELKDDALVKLYWDEPAINNEMRGVILNIDDKDIRNSPDISKALIGKRPGDNITLYTKYQSENKSWVYVQYNFILGEDYTNSSRPILGISTFSNANSGVINKAFSSLMNLFRDPSTHYEPRINEDFARFIKELLWWVALINISVAIFNMIPVPIFDGGRFFYLTIFAITRKEKIAEIALKVISWIIGLIFLILMIQWVKGSFLS